MKKTSIRWPLAVTLLGCALFAAGGIDRMAFDLELPAYVLLAAGCALFGGGLGDVLRRLALRSDPQLAKEVAIEEGDERNVSIANAAKAKAFDAMLLVYPPLLLVLALALAGVEILPLLLVAAAYLFTVGVSIYWQARYRREG